MRIVVISPEGNEPRELAVLEELFAAGLERYHVRKPGWSREELESWLKAVSADWRQRLVLHGHHELALEFGCGGIHLKAGQAAEEMRSQAFHGCLRSRSCHTKPELVDSEGGFETVFFSPVFPSISKTGYLPGSKELGEVREWLKSHPRDRRRTEVIALGGMMPGNALEALKMGFDGVALYGALWTGSNPCGIYEEVRKNVYSHAN